MDRRTFLAASASLALPGAVRAADPVKVGLLLVGPRNDGGWSQHHYESAQEMVAHFDGGVELVYQESVPEGPDAERALTHMALGGADLIFAASFGYMDPTIKVASQFPNVRFEHATGYKTSENVTVYNPRFYEGLAVMGYIAGKMTETNRIGIVAPFPIPLVVRGINSIFVNARKVNPHIDIEVVWINTWYDPAKEGDATQALLNQQSDFVFSLTDSTATLATIQQNGSGYGFGFTSDMASYAPDPRLSSVITNWTPYYIERVQSLIDGTWQSGIRWDGLAKGMIKVGDFSETIPEDVRKGAAEMVSDIASGKYHPFTGPLNKQDGSAWLADGETPDDASLSAMTFFLEGITSKIPS